MTLSASTHKAALTDHFADPFVRENVARRFDVVLRHDVRKFDADAILYGDTRCKKMNTSMFKRCFQRDFGWNQVKICKNTSTFFIFTTVFCRYSLFFFSRSTAGEGGTEKYQPWYQPWYQPST